MPKSNLLPEQWWYNLLNFSRFFDIASEILIKHQAMVDKLVGNQARRLFVLGFAGLQHGHQAINAAKELLHATGHVGSESPWIPLVIGIHTGVAFVGSVESYGTTTDITVLGDPRT